MNKQTKLIVLGITLLLIAHSASAQNWGFSLPGGMGGFAIDKKNWAVGFAGAQAGGGPGGWGFGLPNGAGFYNGNGGGGWGNGGWGGGGWGGGPTTMPLPAGAAPGYAPMQGAYDPARMMPNVSPNIPPAINGVIVPQNPTPGMYGGYGRGPGQPFQRYGPQTSFTSGWVRY